MSLTDNVPSTPLPTPPELVVECRRVDYARRQRLVLKHIDLSVPRGTTLGLIGPNGGGKTTLIRLLVGLLPPTRGDIFICGHPPAAATRRGDLVGYLPQLPHIDTHLPLTVRQTVELGLAGKLGLFSPLTGRDRAAVEETIAQVDLQENADDPIGMLSGGQLQRLLIARALVCHPQLLVLDEPTTGIDALAQDRFVALLRQLKQQLQLTLIIASHDLRVIGSLCDSVACLNVSLHLHDQRQPMSPEEAHALLCHFGATLQREVDRPANTQPE